tara:strand:- start:1266 stop:1658 length:393 start_codon:yes stop_codon:yes gene_type:complete
MRYLLDTHVLIWFDSSPEKLSRKVLDILLDENNDLYISHVSLWEMQIKSQLGKLTLESSLQDLVGSQQRINGLKILNIQAEHIYALESLASYHRDPFDRLLIAQSMIEQLAFLTADEKIHQYQNNIECLW